MRKRFRRLSEYTSGDGLGAFLVRAVAGSGAVHIAGMAVTFLVGVLLARILGVAGYGYYGIAMAIVALASVPGEFGLPQLVTREVAAAAARREESRLHGVLQWAKRMALLFGFTAAAVVAIIAQFLPARASADLAPAIMIGALIVPLAAQARIRGAALQGLHFVTLGQLLTALLQPSLLAILLILLWVVSKSGTVAAAMALNLLSAAVVLAIAHILLRRRLGKDEGVHDRPAGRRWLASAFPMALTEGMRMLQGQLAILLVGIMAAPEETGLFRLAVSITVMIAVPITLINLVVAPVLARLHSEQDIGRLRQLCRRSAQAMTAGVAALILPFALIGPTLIAIVFGSDFAPAHYSLLIMACGQLASAFFGPNAMLLNMTGHEKRLTVAMLLALIANAGLILLLVPIMGQVGAAWATAASTLVWNLLAWKDSLKLLRVDTSLLQLGMPSIRRGDDDKSGDPIE